MIKETSLEEAKRAAVYLPLRSPLIDILALRVPTDAVLTHDSLFPH
jgi:hypothetical protein